MDIAHLGCYCAGLGSVAWRKVWLYAGEDGMGDEWTREEMIGHSLWMEFNRALSIHFSPAEDLTMMSACTHAFPIHSSLIAIDTF